MCYTPQSFLEWCIKPKIIRKGIMHPILNLPDTFMHMVGIHMSALTQFTNDCFDHSLALLDQLLAIVTKLTYQGMHCPRFEDAGRDANSGEA